MAKVGRPTDYRPEYCEMLIEHMKTGLSFESFAAVIGTSSQTMYAWIKEKKEFLDAKQRGTDLSRMFWEKSGVDGLWEHEEWDSKTKTKKSKKINDRIWRLNMANRFGWRENQTLQEKIVEKRLIIKKKSDKEDE